jgi:hypothetical protein
MKGYEKEFSDGDSSMNRRKGPMGCPWESKWGPKDNESEPGWDVVRPTEKPVEPHKSVQ